MTDRVPDIKEILDSYDRSQEALNFTPRSDNDIRAQMIAKAVREWNGDLVEALEPFAACVFNDNGDITLSVSLAKSDDFVRAYFHLRALKDTK